jgi:hypothetical protein
MSVNPYIDHHDPDEYLESDDTTGDTSTGDDWSDVDSEEPIFSKVICSFDTFANLTLGWENLALSQQRHMNTLDNYIDELLEYNEELVANNEALNQTLDLACEALASASAIFLRLIGTGVISDEEESLFDFLRYTGNEVGPDRDSNEEVSDTDV